MHAGMLQLAEVSWASLSFLRCWDGRYTVPFCAPAGIPVWISWLKYLSFIYYGFGLLLHYEYHGRTIYSCVNPVALANGAMSVQVPHHLPMSSFLSMHLLHISACQESHQAGAFSLEDVQLAMAMPL